MTAADLSMTKSHADGLFRRKRLLAFAVPAVLLAYLVYVFFAFDIPGLAKRANWDNAVTLASDSWSYKVHVTRSNRSGEIEYAIEGERKGAYPAGQRPDWVTGENIVTVDLGGATLVHLLPENRTEIDVPGFGRIEAQAQGRQVTTNLPEDVPDWINAFDRRVSLTLPQGRITLTGSKTEVFNYFPGWELFWFTLDTPNSGQGIGWILFGDQIDPARGIIGGALSD